MHAAPMHLWLHGESVGEFERAAGLLRALVRQCPRYRLLLTSRLTATRRWLGAQYPDATVTAPPARIGPLAQWFLVRHRVHGLVILGGYRDLGAAVVAVARWLRVSVVAVGSTGLVPAGDVRGGVDGFVVGDLDATALLAAGVPAARVVVARNDEASADGVTRLLRERPSGPARGAPVGVSRVSRTIVLSRPARALLALRATRLDDLAAVGAALGHPQSILCLGNGPSSEDPRLTSIGFDALFRTNARWRGRGILTRPDVVFGSDVPSLRGAGMPIRGLRVIDNEHRLLRRQAFALWPWRLRYFTLERLPVSINEVAWPARPTSGAVMIAVAAALRPRRLVVAGIDLYEDPRGAYAGDTMTENSYPLMHERATDLAVIDQALRGFDGELVILSEPLRRGLAGLRGLAVGGPRG